MTPSERSSTGAAVQAECTVEIDGAFCKGCGLCVAFCPHDVLELAATPNYRGVCVARVGAPAGCRGCRSCALVCPEGAIQIYRP